MNSSAALSPETRKVSVVVPSYNHAQYITEALESILRQTYRDFEIIILDDASADQSAEQIERFIDCHPEVPFRFIRHERNMGGVITLNDLIQNARGEYIALNNSDDTWLPDKLEQQVAYLDSHPDVGAVFTQAVIVGDNGQTITANEDFSADIFIQHNRTRGKWLRRFFFELNCLCHPSILIRREVYDQVGLYDPRFRQLPDMQMWVRLVKHTEIHILEQPLVHLRFHTSNTSKVSVDTSIRNLNELSLILESFFDGAPDEIVAEGFQDLLRKKGSLTPAEMTCEKAFLYFLPEFSFKYLYYHAGLRQLYQLLDQEQAREVLRSQYNFDYNQFFSMSGSHFFDGDIVASLSDMAEAASGLQGVTAFLRHMIAKDRHYLAVYLLRRYPTAHRRLLKLWSALKGRRA